MPPKLTSTTAPESTILVPLVSFEHLVDAGEQQFPR
jgi:hypothetical protein